MRECKCKPTKKRGRIRKYAPEKKRFTLMEAAIVHAGPQQLTQSHFIRVIS